MTTILDALQALANLFESLSVPYAVMGGIAVRIYGLPRPTYDVDFAVEIPRERLPELYRASREIRITVPETYERGWIDIVAGMPIVKFRIYLEQHGIDIDLFLAETDFQRELIARRRWEAVDGFSAWIVSVEDLILLKLIAYRPRDIADIQDIILIQGELDVAYMRRWADDLQVRQRLENMLIGHYEI